VETRPGGEGLGPALRGVAATLLDMVATRAELALVELREEGERRKRMLYLALAAAMSVAVALVFAGAFVVACFWDTHRLWALAGVTALYLAIAVGAIARLRGMGREAPPPFHETLSNLAADRELLHPGE
jgi:uncharacterized membrane protein YqjE